MNGFELFKKKIKEASDQKINEMISKGILKMSDEQIATISFAFWLVYMVETDLNTVLHESWESSMSFFFSGSKNGS